MDAQPAFAALQSEAAAPTGFRAAISAAHRLPEPQSVAALIDIAAATSQESARIRDLAGRLAGALRAKSRARSGGVEGLIHEYSLSSQEGVALMCLAEALLRIPDAATRDALIRDKLSPGDWRAHVGQSPSPVRQRRHLGPRADRQAGGDQQRAGPFGRADPAARPLRRADHPRRRRRGDAADGRAIRHRAHHRGGAAGEPVARGARLLLLLRHARRGGDDG